MRRFLLFIIIIAVLIFGISRMTKRNAGMHRPEKYTPAESSKINPENVKVLAALDEEFTHVVDAVVPSVVSITTSRRVRTQNGPYLVDPFEQFFGMRRRAPQVPQERIQNSLGSGVIVSKEGHILTNYHVIANMDDVKVQLSDGRTEPAEVIGSDERTDIAVLKISTKDLVPLPLGDSDQVKVGQLVFAIGNPFNLGETVTQGIISAKGREDADSGNEFLQTDTAINPGNSGGPLVNLRGEIIGINSAIFSTSQSQTPAWQGVGFAIPSNVARRALESVIKNGRVSRGFLGVVIPQNAAEPVVTEVAPDSPAERAGIKEGDIIKEFNGHAVSGIRDLRKRVAEVAVGEKAKVKLSRANAEVNVTVEIAEQTAATQARQNPRRQPNQPPIVPATQNILAGIRVTDIPNEQRTRLPENVHGVMVVQIDPNSPAADVLQTGDVIEEIDREPINSVADFDRIAASRAGEEKRMLFISRGRTRSFVILTR
jgi:serine protease Do